MNLSDKVENLLQESDKLLKELNWNPRTLDNQEDKVFFLEWLEKNKKYDVI